MSGHWHYDRGVLVESTVDHGDGTGTRTTYAADGSVESTETVAGLPLAGPPFASLDPAGALATLLVVVGALELVDAAAAIHVEPDHMIHEATAWTL